MTVVTFGAVPNGRLSDDFTDVTANGDGPNGVGTKILPSDLKAGRFMIRLTANAAYSPVYYNDPSKVRIHLIGNRAIEQMMQIGGRFARCLSWRWVQTPVYNLYAGDEIHAKGSGPLANGPAPKGGPFWISANQYSVVIRGGGNVGSQGSYTEWRFGEDRGNQPPNRFSQKWQGMPNVAGTAWLTSFEEFDFHSDPTKGSYALWLAETGKKAVNVVPKIKIATCFPSPITNYPMLSNYFERAVAGWHTIDNAGGGYCLDPAELREWQPGEIGFDPWGAPVPKLRKKSETAHTITLQWDPVPGAYGFRYFENGKPVSWRALGTVTEATFDKVDENTGQPITEYGVLPLEAGDLLTYRP